MEEIQTTLSNINQLRSLRHDLLLSRHHKKPVIYFGYITDTKIRMGCANDLLSVSRAHETVFGRFYLCQVVDTPNNAKLFHSLLTNPEVVMHLINDTGADIVHIDRDGHEMYIVRRTPICAPDADINTPRSLSPHIHEGHYEVHNRRPSRQV